MLKLVLILLIICLVLLFPFKIKLSIKYIDNKLQVFFYSKEINKLTAKKKKKKKKTNKIKSKDIFEILNKIKKSKFKPSLSIQINGEFGFDDAAITGFLYGCINCLTPILYQIFTSHLNVKKFKINFVPKYNENTISFEINSIILINLANIIYINNLRKNYIKSKKTHLATEEVI